MIEDRLAYTPAETARLLNLSLNNVYSLIRIGRIPSIKLGRRILIPKVELDRLMQSSTTKHEE